MEMAVAIIAAAAVATAVAAIRDTEHALDRAHSAADAGTDGSADHAAYRTGGPITLIGALMRPADDALGMAGLGDSRQRQCEGGGRKQEPRGEAGWDDGRRLNLGVVPLGSLIRGADSPPATGTSGLVFSRPRRPRPWRSDECATSTCRWCCCKSASRS